METMLPAVEGEFESSRILALLWERICKKLYVPAHSMSEVTSKLFAETKEFPDGDSHYVITQLIEKCKTNGKLLDAIMQEQKSYANAFDYFYNKASTFGYKMRHGCYLDNKKALELAEEYFMIDDAEEYWENLFGQIKDEGAKERIAMELKFDGDIERYHASIKEELASEVQLKKENPDEYKARYEKKVPAKRSKSKKKKTVKEKEPLSASAVKETKQVSEMTATVSDREQEAAATKETTKPDSFTQMSIWDVM